MKERYEAIEQLITAKKEQIEQLQYELTLLKKDCVNEFKKQSKLMTSFEFDRFTETLYYSDYKFKPITKEIKSPKNEIEQTIRTIQTQFGLVDAEFNKKPLMGSGIDFRTLQIYFKYMGEQFELDIPYIVELERYENLDKAYYTLFVEKNGILQTIERFYDFDETKECLKKALDEYIKEHKGEKKNES